MCQITSFGNHKDLFNKINSYGISLETMSKITGIKEPIIEDYYKYGNLKNITKEEEKYFNDILLQLGEGITLVTEDERLKAIIQSLNDSYGISHETLAMYAKLQSKQILEFLTNINSMKYEELYRLAVTSIFLHFLFNKNHEK